MPSLQPGQVSEPLALLLLPQPNVYKNLRHESGSRPANSEWLLRQFSMKKRETFVSRYPRWAPVRTNYSFKTFTNSASDVIRAPSHELTASKPSVSSKFGSISSVAAIPSS